VIEVPAFASQQNVNPPITEPDTNLGYLPDPLPQHSVILDRFVVDGTLQANHFAGSPDANSVGKVKAVGHSSLG
jgi:hypothetical protein